MPITFSGGSSVLNAQRRVSESTSALGKIFERLSSGQRINRASDDAAGLAVASSLTSKARVYSQAIRNINDGFSALNIATGGLEQLNAVSVRARELATSAANSTLSRTQRLALDGEAKALAAEFNRVVETTAFNGLRLIDGKLREFILQLGYGESELLQIGLGTALARNIGNSNFTAGTATTGEEEATEGLTGDFNGDGNLDVLMNTLLTGTLTVRYGNGQGGFSTSKAITLSGGAALAGNLSVADVNGDGRDDIVGIRAGSVNVVLSTGTDFAAASVVATGASDLVTADFNGDGRVDIGYLVGGSVLSALGNGNGTFGTARSVAVGFNASEIVTGDFNGDGSIDIAASNSTSVRTLNGNGIGSFSSGSLTVLTEQGSGFVAGDFNQDGITDLGYQNSAKGLAVALGRSNGSFGTSTNFAGGALNSGLSLTDINGDGILDVVGGSTLNVFSYFLGAADGTFGAVNTRTLTGMSGVGLLAVPGDFNNDGVVDVFANDSGGPIYSSYIYHQGATAYSTIATINISTRDAARSALGIIDSILARISSETGRIGGAQSRLSSALSTLQTRSENYLSAASRITDTDIAQESSQAIRLQILQQSAASVLAQANTTPQLALLLLNR